MKLVYRLTLAALSAICALGIATPASAQFFRAGPCQRADLEEVAGKYIEAQKAGNPGLLPFGTEWMDYKENGEVSSMYSGGVIGKPLKIDWYRIHYDPAQCRFMAEIIVTDKEHPYVLAVQASAQGTNIGPTNVIVTDADDWLFDAEHTLYYVQHEDWSVIPPEKRNTRAELIAAADAYLDYFKDKSVVVPWGTPCNRLEGSVYTGKGKSEDSCNVGVPNDISLIDRSYVVDETLGSVSVFLRFGNEGGAYDSHLFRIEDGKIRYVHTVTNCGERPNCGFEPFKDMIAKNPDMWPKLD